MSNLKQIRDNVSHLNVLYVEDETQVRDMTVKFLNKIFTNVDSAIDGQDGLDHFKANKYDLVITDLKMPKMNGRDMLGKIKELDEDVVLLVITAADSKMDATLTACDAYIKKPVKINDFLESIEKLQDRFRKK